MVEATAPRDHLVRALHADLIGPYQLDEEAVAEQDLLALVAQAAKSAGLSWSSLSAPLEAAEGNTVRGGKGQAKGTSEGDPQ